jgi:hypothetical protein
MAAYVPAELEAEFALQFPDWKVIRPSYALYSSAIMFAGAAIATKQDGVLVIRDELGDEE